MKWQSECVLCFYHKKCFFNFILIFFSRNQQCTLIYEDHVRSFQNARNVGVPKAPKTVSEIRAQYNKPAIFNVYGQTDHDDKREIFFDHLYEGKDFSYCIFSSKKIMTMIQKHMEVFERHYLIDATFKVCFLFGFQNIFPFVFDFF